ncbi:MAG: hypothetical protein RLZZ624_436 [Cyanobacteriota bacterium]|jgi:hypothetical protein
MTVPLRHDRRCVIGWGGKVSNVSVPCRPVKLCEYLF